VRAVTPKPKKSASHVPCQCEDLAELRPHILSHFMEPSDYDKILLCTILCFIGHMGLLVEWKNGEYILNQKMVMVQGSPCVSTPLILILISKCKISGSHSGEYEV
jgi:hypothetical protein